MLVTVVFVIIFIWISWTWQSDYGYKQASVFGLINYLEGRHNNFFSIFIHSLRPYKLKIEDDRCLARVSARRIVISREYGGMCILWWPLRKTLWSLWNPRQRRWHYPGYSCVVIFVNKLCDIITPNHFKLQTTLSKTGV